MKRHLSLLTWDNPYEKTNMTKQDVMDELLKVNHPAIDYSLIKLGIVSDVKLEGNKVSVVFAFPFPNIPIAQELVNSVAQPVQALDLEFEYDIRLMSEEEKNRFLELEAQAWKGS